MRIGLVVDSACDLPGDFLARNGITILPITVRIGDAVLADHRNERRRCEFLHAHVAERGADAETTPFTVQQIQDLFLQKLVIDYDYVFCMTITTTRSPIFDNAMQASFAILNEYRAVRSAAGNDTPFALRVIDTQNLFAAQGILRWKRCACAKPAKARRRSARGWNTSRCTPTATWSRATCITCAARARKKGDRSVSLLSAALGTALDIKPVLHCQPRRDRPGGEDQGLRRRGAQAVRVRRAPGRSRAC